MKNKKIRGPNAVEVTIFVPSHIVTITQRMHLKAVSKTHDI